MGKDVKLIQIEMDVDNETVTATYVDPEKIAGMLSEEKSLGGYLRELRDTQLDDEVSLPTMPPRTMTQREVDLINGFEALMDKAETTPDEVRAMISGIVAGFAYRSKISLDELHDDIDAAYAYRISHQERPS